MIETLYRAAAVGLPPAFPIWTPSRANASGAVVTVSCIFVNAQQLPYLLRSAGVTLTPGAAQYPISWAVTIRDPDATVNYPIAGDQLPLTVAAVITRVARYVDILVPPRWGIIGFGQFNAGAAANSVSLEVVGYYIPRGNLGLP